ncbi:four helix bundle protein [Patescibacteria group bacterium]
MYNFEKLNVWKKAMDLAEFLYELQCQFPKEEKHELGSQLRRAATSIPLNIAEGSSSHSRKVFRQYLLTARGSLYEIVTILKLARRFYNIKTDKGLSSCSEVGRLLSGLVNSL